MNIEQIEAKDIPPTVRANQENFAIYQAAKKILTLGVGRAIRVRLDGVSPQHACKKAHVYYRFRPFRLRTKHLSGYLYMWIEDREPKRFEVVAVPQTKTELRRA